ncbi:MAG: helix-turn-helix domain-containing protein [Bacteroides sp.]
MENFKLLNTEQVAEILNFTVPYIRKLSREGKIKSIKIGKEIRFTEQDIREYIENHRR